MTYQSAPPTLISRTTSRATRVFGTNAAAFLLSSLAYFGVLVGLYAAYIAVLYVLDVRMNLGQQTLNTVMPFAVVVLVVGIVLTWTMMTANQYRCAHDALDGKPVRCRDFFSLQRVGVFFVVGLICNVGMLAGTLFLGVGAYVVAFFTVLAPAFAVTRGARASIGEAMRVAKDNAGQVFMLFLLTAVCSIVEAMTLGLALVLTLPFRAVLVSAFAKLVQGSAEDFARG